MINIDGETNKNKNKAEPPPPQILKTKGMYLCQDNKI